MLVIALAGCSRAYYRRQADDAAYCAVSQATITPRFKLENYTINIDPRSRLFDPTNPDRPPMPPDDPEAHRYMNSVGGMKGFPRWHEDGDLPDVEVSDWRRYLPTNEKDEVVIDLQGAMRLARLHSREYQSQLETLYLSALDVTFERFRFQTQFFGGNTTTETVVGRDRAGGKQLSTLATNTNLQARKLTATGGELLAGVANSIVWQFSGADSSLHTSLLNFAFTQPLLRFGGRPRVLERLTRVERGLLYNVRQYERYRQGFFIDVTTQRGQAGGLSRSGGFFGGAGLEGFSGVGGGGFGRVGGFGGGGAGGFAGGGGAGAQQVGGYIGVLQDQQNIRNQEANVVGLRDTWAQLEAAYDAGRIDNRFQVDFARQAYFTGQSVLLNTKAAYQTNLDAFKLSMGLPPDVNLVARDRLLDRFNLIDSDVTRLQARVGDLLDLIRDRDRPTELADFEPWFTELDAIRAGVEAHLQTLDEDIRQITRRLPERRQALAALGNRPEVTRGDLDRSAIDPARLDARVEAIERDRAQMTREFSAAWAEFGAIADVVDSDNRQLSRERLSEAVTQLSGRLLEMSLLQARARLDGIGLTSIELDPREAFEIALANRADWMNAQANLVDTWRLIRFNANALRSGLNLTLNGDIGTVGNNPIRFRDTNAQLQAGVQFDAPLTRVAERNIYRQALIEYQQARRSLMQFRDGIYQGVRARMRQIGLDQVNLELRRAAVEVAIGQVDLARLKLGQPLKPGETAQFSPTTARDLVDALANLQQAQNNFLSVWVDYEAQRMGLDYDLGTMRLNDEGIWLDPGPVRSGQFRGQNAAGGSNGGESIECDPRWIPPESPELDLNSDRAQVGELPSPSPGTTVTEPPAPERVAPAPPP